MNHGDYTYLLQQLTELTEEITQLEKLMIKTTIMFKKNVMFVLRRYNI